MEPSTRTLAPITSTNEAKASMSTASSTASRTSDSPSKSPLWRLPPDVLTNLQPSYWTRRSSHGPPDGGPAGAVPPAGFVLDEIVLGPLVGDLEAEHVAPEVQACGHVEHRQFRHECREPAGWRMIRGGHRSSATRGAGVFGSPDRRRTSFHHLSLAARDAG